MMLGSFPTASQQCAPLHDMDKADLLGKGGPAPEQSGQYTCSEHHLLQ